MNGPLLLSALAFVAGGLILIGGLGRGRRLALSLRLAHAAVEPEASNWPLELLLRRGLARPGRFYTRALRQAGSPKTLAALLREKLLLAAAFPLVPLLPYAAIFGRLPAPVLLLALAPGGFFAPDLVLRQAVRRRKEALFLDLPELVTLLSLALRAGRSLPSALALAARAAGGPLGEELTHALSLARRERLDERTALTRVAREAGEPSFSRFAELLAVKESPYGEFLRGQAAQLRAEQSRYLERAADRAYLAMHAPLAPLMVVLVLLVAYGFFHFLGQTI